MFGKEYWGSRLHKHGEILGRFTKILTHRKERRVAKNELRRDDPQPEKRKSF